jgi:MFS family permease
MRLHIPVALHHKRYTYYWVGIMISVVGTRMQLAALFWHINELSDDPIALGAVGAARILPVIVFSLLGGAVADVVNRRRLLFLTQSSMALLALGLSWLSFTGEIQLWHIYLLTALNAMAVSFDSPARQSLVPNLVSPEDLPNAFSMNSIAWRTGAILGPAIGGWVIAFVGLPYTYLFNAISYLAVIFALILMGEVAQDSDRKREDKRVSRESIREGLKFTFGQEIILSTMVLDFVATFFSSFEALIPIFAVDILHVDSVAYGWLLSAQSIGAMLAAVVLSQFDEIRRQGRILMGAVVIFGAATFFFGLSQTFALSMAAMIIVGASDSVSTVIRNTIRQLRTPDSLRGRMTSINMIFFQGGPRIGEFETGLVAQFLGVPVAVASGGIACILGVGIIHRIWPQLTRYNGDEPIAAGAPADSLMT